MCSSDLTIAIRLNLPAVIVGAVVSKHHKISGHYYQIVLLNKQNRLIGTMLMVSLAISMDALELLSVKLVLSLDDAINF